MLIRDKGSGSVPIKLLRLYLSNSNSNSDFSFELYEALTLEDVRIFLENVVKYFEMRDFEGQGY